MGRAEELAASQAYAEQVARDPEIQRRVEEARAQLASGTLDPANVIPYESLLEVIDGLRGQVERDENEPPA